MASITMPHKRENGLNLSLDILQYGVLYLLWHLVFNFKCISNLIITPAYSVIFIQWDPSFHTEGEGGFNGPSLMKFHARRDVRSHFAEVLLGGKCGFVSLESLTQCPYGIYTVVSSGPPFWLAEQHPESVDIYYASFTACNTILLFVNGDPDRSTRLFNSLGLLLFGFCYYFFKEIHIFI